LRGASRTLEETDMAKLNREMVWWQCTETGDLNYRTELKVVGGAPKIEMKKYSPRLRRHTLHKIKRK
jgi:large subunit ribosomal protein L33